MIQAFRSFLARRRPPVDAASNTPLPGLEAFGPESADRPWGGAGGWVSSRVLTPLLAALVAVQAVPTALWMRNLLAPPAVPQVAAAHAETPRPADVRLEPVVLPAGRPAPTTGVRRSPQTATAPTAAPAPRRIQRDTRAAPAAGPPPIQAGRLAVAAPVPMQVRERGRVVGTSEAETIILPIGTHTLEFVSEAFGYRVTRTVTVQAGDTTRVEIPAPSGTLHVNALPWAEVWIDGQPTGETPLGNLPTPIGTREVVLRHPELGERRRTVLVTLLAPARVSVDLRQP
jgi:hypothetical protein